MQRVRRAVGIGLAALLLSGCVGGASDDVATARPTWCSAVTEFEHAVNERQRLHAGLAIPAEEVARILDEHQRAAVQLHESVSTDLRGLTRQYVESLDKGNARLLQDWGPDGVDLIARLDRSDLSPRFAFQVPAGAELGERLDLACDVPPPGWVVAGPRRATELPDVDLVAVRKAGDRFQLMSFHEGSESIIALPDGLEATQPTISPDGKTLALIAFDDETRGVVVGSTDGSDLEFVSPAAERWTCPSFAQRDGDLLVTRKVSEGAWVLSRFDTGSGTTADLSAPLPFRSAPCGGVVVDGSIVAEAGGPDGWIALGTHRADQDQPEPFAELEGCNIVYPQRRPGSDRLYVIAGCADIYRAGLWSVAADGSDWRHELGGSIAAPMWSPDGAWVAFGHQPFGEAAAGPSLWVSNADFTIMGQVADRWTSWPAWRSSPSRS